MVKMLIGTSDRKGGRALRTALAVFLTFVMAIFGVVPYAPARAGDGEAVTVNLALSSHDGNEYYDDYFSYSTPGAAGGVRCRPVAAKKVHSATLQA
jgi:hypothetical protein